MHRSTAITIKATLFALFFLIAAPYHAGTQAAIPTTYPWHDNIITTMFYVGEEASTDNGWIDNKSSAWYADWIREFGCVDDPDKRKDGKSADCYVNGKDGPKENSYYFALPFGDYDEDGVLEQIGQIPWYEAEKGDEVYTSGGSLLKDHWIEIKSTRDEDGIERTCYAQWADVGPFESSDGEYVWNGAEPTYQNPETGDRIGLDLSPAATDCLGLDGYDTTSWRFIEASRVPDGPWKETVTNSPPNWTPPSTPQGALSSLWCHVLDLFNLECHQFNKKILP